LDLKKQKQKKETTQIAIQRITNFQKQSNLFYLKFTTHLSKKKVEYFLMNCMNEIKMSINVHFYKII